MKSSRRLAAIVGGILVAGLIIGLRRAAVDSPRVDPPSWRREPSRTESRPHSDAPARQAVERRDFEDDASNWRYRTVDKYGPVPDADLFFVDPTDRFYSTSALRAFATTDADGGARFDGRWPDGLHVVAISKNSASTSVPRPDSDRDPVELTIAETAALTIRVLGRDGRPVGGLRIGAAVGAPLTSAPTEAGLVPSASPRTGAVIGETDSHGAAILGGLAGDDWWISILSPAYVFEGRRNPFLERVDVGKAIELVAAPVFAAVAVVETGVVPLASWGAAVSGLPGQSEDASIGATSAAMNSAAAKIRLLFPNADFVFCAVPKQGSEEEFSRSSQEVDLFFANGVTTKARIPFRPVSTMTSPVIVDCTHVDGTDRASSLSVGLVTPSGRELHGIPLHARRVDNQRFPLLELRSSLRRPVPPGSYAVGLAAPLRGDDGAAVFLRGRVVVVDGESNLRIVAEEELCSVTMRFRTTGAGWDVAGRFHIKGARGSMMGLISESTSVLLPAGKWSMSWDYGAAKSGASSFEISDGSPSLEVGCDI